MSQQHTPMLDAQGMFKAAMRVLTNHAINRYLMSNAYGRWDGAEKAHRHDELCRFHICAAFGIADPEQARFDHEEPFQAVHEETQELTAYLDEAIGFPLDSRPDYDALAPLFFEKFHAIALAAIAKTQGS